MFWFFRILLNFHERRLVIKPPPIQTIFKNIFFFVINACLKREISQMNKTIHIFTLSIFNAIQSDRQPRIQRNTPLANSKLANMTVAMPT
ncbi:hypothetical protein O162_21840 [Pseudomonas putida SJ3]|nr:hypothetical protein O162_21840 [Pseudomonas putida SJ3]